MSHPDDFTGLMNWPLYGPRDPEIERLVSHVHGGDKPGQWSVVLMASASE